MAKIVLSANTGWNIYNFRKHLVEALIEDKHEVIVVSSFTEDTLTKLKSLGCKTADIYINSKSINPVYEMKTLYEYYKIYRKIKPDLVLNFTVKPVIYSSIAASILNIPIINTITGLGTGFLKGNFITYIIKKLYKLSQKNVHKVVFQNKYDMEYFLAEELVSPGQAEIIPGSGVDTEFFSPIEVKKKDSTFRFLLIARMLWDKGIKEYVEAARIIKRKYKDVEFTLLGPTGVDNPSAIPEETIHQWEKEGVIRYLGAVEDTRPYIAEADCVVLPSYREGTSRVLLESASMGKPIIATDVPGCNNIVIDGWNGFLCKVKDFKDLANKMEKMLLLDDETRRLMGMRGRSKMIKEFDTKIIVDKYTKIIETVLNKRVKVR